MADSVTISREYLETLVRRANLYDADGYTRISIVRHKFLVQQARAFRYLKEALIAGGTPETSLQVLIDSQRPETVSEAEDSNCDDTSHESSHGTQYESGVELQPSEPSLESYHHPYPTKPLTPPSTNDYEEEFTDIEDSPDQRQFYETSFGKRSLLFRELPKTTTTLDVVNIVKGGAVAKAFMRHRDYTAHVSFVSPEAAQAFYAYTQRNRIMIKGSIIKVSWDRQQLPLPGFLMNLIHERGATRNLVIRSLHPSVAAQSIREDLEHIHQLEVLSIELRNEDAWIQLNSIELAASARSCMKSRLKYRQSKISFTTDTCAQTLSSVEVVHRAQPPRKQEACGIPTISLNNPYGVLSLLPLESEDDETEN